MPHRGAGYRGWMGRIGRVVLLAVATLLVGCAPPAPQPQPTPTPSPIPTPAPAPSPTAAATSNSIEVAGATLILPTGASVEQLADGTVSVGLPPRPGRSRVGIEGIGWEVFAGRVLAMNGLLLTRPVVVDAAGAEAVAPFVSDGMDAAVEVPEGAVSVTFLAGSVLVGDTEWESATRILVTPTQLARGLAPGDPIAAAALAPAMMNQVIAREPGHRAALEVPSPINQLACHMVGAPTKETWNLETDREDKGLTGFIASRCN